MDCLSRLLSKGATKNLVEGFSINNTMFSINHLLFADDTMLFSSSKAHSLINMQRLINIFEEASGLNINFSKSEILGLNCDDLLPSIANQWGCKVGTWPNSYLGLPLYGVPRNLSFWSPIIEKIERKLQNWKNNYLSKGGRITLIQSTLTNLPLYYLSLFQIPMKAAKNIEKILRNFLWKGPNLTEGCHLIKWDDVQLPLDSGGLGISKIKDKNTALLSKWLWRFHTEKASLWRKVIADKYNFSLVGDYHFSPRFKKYKGPWTAICKLAEDFYSKIKIKVGNGKSTRFWEDHWIGEAPLAITYPSLFTLARNKKTLVADAWNKNHGSWIYNFRRNFTEEEFLDWTSLNNSLPLSPITNKEDICVWTEAKTGVYTCKSLMWILNNNNSNPCPSIFRSIWKDKVKKYPKKVKFFLWEIARGKINTCDMIQKRNPHISLSPSCCPMCENSEETQDHLFLHCQYANLLWKDLFSIFKWRSPMPGHVQQTLSFLLEGHPYRKVKRILWAQLIRASFWHLWMERNNRIFNNKKKSMHSLIEMVFCTGLLWCKAYRPFNSYSLSFLCKNWNSFL